MLEQCETARFNTELSDREEAFRKQNENFQKTPNDLSGYKEARAQVWAEKDRELEEKIRKMEEQKEAKEKQEKKI